MLLYIDKINEFIKQISSKKEKIHVLEAGCGSSSRFDFGQNAFITGIDISLEQLQKNKVLHNKILGDIQTIRFKPSSFDIIICWEVLEHLKKPKCVLNNFVQILKNNGIIIISVPNLLSLKGLVTKFTPYRFHDWCNKLIFKWKIPTFPTSFKIFISPISLKNFSKENNLLVHWSHFQDGWTKNLKKKSSLFYTVYLGLGLMFKILTFGIISIHNTDFIIVYRKI